MKVYIVTNGEYSNYMIEKVFSNREAAEEFKKWHHISNDIEEYEIYDEPFGPNEGEKAMFIRVQGTVYPEAVVDIKFDIRPDLCQEGSITRGSGIMSYKKPGPGVFTIYTYRYIQSDKWDEEKYKAKFTKSLYDLASRAKAMFAEGASVRDVELANLADRVLKYFGSIEQLQAYWKTTIGKDINDLATKEFGISLYRFKQVVLGTLHIEDKTKEDVKLLKQKAWEERPAYTLEQIDNMYAKRKETCQKLYGVDNVFQSEDVKERIRSTCFDRYGAYNINSTEENKQYKAELAKQRTSEELFLINEKAKQTCLQKYGVPNASQSAEVISKIFETKESRYGNASYNNRAKAKTTCLDRYGAESFSQTADFINAAKYRKYCVDSAFFDSYPELAVYLYCIHNKISIQRSPTRFEYTFNNKTHYCFPDFLIDETLVEIKGAHLFERMQGPGTIDNAKLNCLTQHNVEIWTTDKYKPYITWFKKQGFKKEDYLVRR